jgi:hypothetical protein
MADDRPVVDRAREALAGIVVERGLAGEGVRVLGRPLTPEEAIGVPGRRDYPIIEGRERVIEAEFLGSKGHAFTDSPREFEGSLEEVLALPLETNAERAVFFATLNAVLRRLDLARGTVHCRDDDPEDCAREVAGHLADRHGSVGLVGLNPALAEGLARAFGPGRVRITDLNPACVGAARFGVEVWDGRTRTAELVAESDVVLVTGTTIVNGSFDSIAALARDRGRSLVVFGVTASGVAALTGMPRLCPKSRDA